VLEEGKVEERTALVRGKSNLCQSQESHASGSDCETCFKNLRWHPEVHGPSEELSRYV
jgi:hypothetical protein